MLNKSIAYKLSIYVSLAVIGVFISFIAISYFFNRKILKENIDNQAYGLTSEIIMKVEKYLVATREVSINSAEQAVFYVENGGTEVFLKWLMEKYPFLNAIRINLEDSIQQNYHYYYCYRENDSLHFLYQNKNIVICDNELANQENYEKNTVGWSGPVRCERNQNVIASYHAPILKNVNSAVSRREIGKVVCELSLLNLNDSINSFPIPQNGFAFLLAKDGTYITHPNKNWILTRNVYEISDKIYDRKKINVKELLESQATGSLIAFAEILKFKKTKVFYATIKESGWKLLLVMPFNELFEPLYISMLQMLFFSTLGILIIYLIITFITNRLIEPLSVVTAKLKEFSSASGEELNTLNEVKLVAESLNYIKGWYEKYKQKVSLEKNETKKHFEDLIQASEIQQSLIKTDFPAFPDRREIDIHAIYKPANVISGDLFDYFFIDQERLVFTIGDVSGKGIPAGIFMSVAQTIIKGNATKKQAKSIVISANNELTTNNQHQFFLTLFIGILNVKTGMLNYCNAAHTTAFILKKNGKVIEFNHSHGLPLGLYADKKYTDSKVQLDEQDTLILITDGVSDLQDSNRLHFGLQRLKENISTLVSLTPKNMIKRLESSMKIFQGDAKQIDDITIMAIKWNK